jgi:hypothetical protein
MRLIDADKLIKNIKNTADLGGWIGAAVYHIKQVAIKYIDDAPSIDIIHCVECRYKGMEICPMYKLTKAGVLKPYDFCSYGEREGE